MKNLTEGQNKIIASLVTEKEAFLEPIENKKFYVTKKQVLEYIRLNLDKFNSIEEFKIELKSSLDDLKLFGVDKAQIKFFDRVLEKLS